MGGRGASAGTGGSGSGGGGQQSLQNLVLQIARGQGGQLNWKNNTPYTDNNNPDLLKYQAQTDDKTASFLAGTARSINLNDPKYDDGYVYHNIPLNKLLLRLNITGGPTVLSDKDFNAYCKQTGQTAMYRGWSGQAAVDRFMNATHNHVGSGRYGDGYYFSPSKSTAKQFGSTVTKMALSPSARVIDYSRLRNMMSQASPKLQSALNKAGSTGTGSYYGPNKGEAQYALKMGYNVVDMGGGYLYGVTGDAFVTSKKIL